MQDYDINHARHIFEHFEKCQNWPLERNHFFEQLCAAEFHWFFVQGLDAIQHGFFVPGVSSLLNGIEASLRVTIAQVTMDEISIEELSPYKVLSNNLLKNSLDLGMPVGALAFPDETDFFKKLVTEKPNRIDVEVVRYRNNICHGNIFEFINRELRPREFFLYTRMPQTTCPHTIGSFSCVGGGAW